MRVPYRCRSRAPHPPSTRQPSTRGPALAREPSLPQDASDASLSSGSEDEAYPLDVLSSQTSGARTAGDVTSEAKELVEIALKKFLPASSSRSRDPEDDTIAERFQTSWVEKRVEAEQKSDTGDENIVVVGLPSPTKSHLACPFYVSQKAKYLDCLTRVDLRGIADVKQHLETAHLQPSYCPICNDTFVSASDWSDHVRRRSCASSGKPRPEGITILQLSQLARRFGSWISRELQWSLIWEIVFPGAKLPSLEFPPAGVETAVWALRDFWSAEGAKIVSDFLAERQLHHDKSDFVKLGALVRDLAIDQLVVLCGQAGSNNQD